MSGWPELDRLLQTDPRDVGCADAAGVSRRQLSRATARRSG
jgi:hypothetical protein